MSERIAAGSGAQIKVKVPTRVVVRGMLDDSFYKVPLMLTLQLERGYTAMRPSADRVDDRGGYR
jgi:hypothetical protein